MKPLIFYVCFVFAIGCTKAQTPVWHPSPGHTQIEIWPGAAPDDSLRQTESLDGGAVINVTRPTMTVYSPKGKNTGVAMVVFPGGGYRVLAMGLEGTEVCDWLNSKGITCVLLKYRVPNSGPHWEDQCKCHITPKFPLALEDAQRTIGLVRFHAAEWHIDPHKVGVLGFSAGGHLVADTSTHFDKRSYPPIDAADNESCRPDFGVALYPGHMLENTSKPFELNPNVPVTSNTPPTFLLQAEDDPVDDVENSLVYFEALKTMGVPAEMHIYAKGGHAFGLRPTEFPITGWPKLVEAWLRTIGIISKK